jgi:hypothetical protein
MMQASTGGDFDYLFFNTWDYFEKEMSSTLA